MKTLKFEGYSDDTFGEYNATNDDVDNCSNGDPIQCEIISEEGKLVVVGHYEIHPTDGCWTIGVSPYDEETPLPNWPIRMSKAQRSYSLVLEVDVPDDATLKWYLDGEKYER